MAVDPPQAFLEGVRAGDLEALRNAARETPALLNARDANGVSAVMLAMYHGHAEAARLLAEMGAEIGAFEACVLGQADRLKVMLAVERVLIGRYSVDGFTLLHLAAFFGQPEVAEILLAAGADVICILEPTAGMLSPAQFAEFSAVYIRHVTRSFTYSRASFVYHTCGNTMHLVETMGKAGVQGVSLDSAETGVDLREAASRVSEDVVVIGNISPSTTMRFGTPEEVRRETRALLEAMRAVPNFILSTGCDLPQETPLENIRTFMDVGRAWRA